MTEINVTINSDDVVEAIYDDLVSKIQQGIDVDSISDQVIDNIDLDDLASTLIEKIDLRDLANDIEDYIDFDSKINDYLYNEEFLTESKLEDLAYSYNVSQLCSLGRAVKKVSELSTSVYFRNIREAIENAGGPLEVEMADLEAVNVSDLSSSFTFVSDLIAIINMAIDQRVLLLNNMANESPASLPSMSVDESNVEVVPQQEYRITLTYQQLFDIINQAVINQKWYVENSYPINWKNFYHEMMGNYLDMYPDFDRVLWDKSGPNPNNTGE